ncbi:uncharacterized protein PRD47_001620 isoform 1-T1 [Ara ararauna]
MCSTVTLTWILATAKSGFIWDSEDRNLEGGQGHRSRLKTDLKPQRRSYLGSKTYKKSIILLELEAFISLQLKLVSGTRGCQESDKPRRDHSCRFTSWTWVRIRPVQYFMAPFTTFWIPGEKIWARRELW